MKTGLFFGSFNPIHIGHLAIANYMVEYTDLDQIWFVVSPQNPFKQKNTLLAEYDRLELVELAIGDDDRFRASNIEFNLPKPSYTIDTLTYMRERFRHNEFALIIGSDNLKSFHKWKNYDLLLENHELYVYPRPGFKKEDIKVKGKINIVEAPLMEISSSFIREAIRDKKDIPYFLPKGVYQYIKKMHFYEK